MPHIQLGRLAIGLLGAALVGAGGWFASSILGTPVADMHIEPRGGSVVTGDTFQIKVVVDAEVPVNVFKGVLTFDEERLTVDRIDYNTSIADLWAEEPWYSEGGGTINFIGGTTARGGFSGSGTLLTVTFRGDGLGSAAIGMREVRILQHDGLGTEAEVAEPIDALFTVENQQVAREATVTQKTAAGPNITVLERAPSTDLNDDGRHSMADVSIFMQHLANGNMQADFNQDGRVSTADMSILLKQF